MINVILYHPEIPQNTGNIMRTCAAIGARLHIIGPIPFQLGDDQLRRAGMDYMNVGEYVLYPSYDDFVEKVGPTETFYITRYGNKAPSSIDFSRPEINYYVMFGSESTGIPHEILSNHLDHCLRLPMKPFARSLNLANTVAIVVYEMLRQQSYEGLSTNEVLKGEDFLEKGGTTNE